MEILQIKIVETYRLYHDINETDRQTTAASKTPFQNRLTVDNVAVS